MRRLPTSDPHHATQLHAIGQLRRDLAARGVTVHMHVNEPEHGGWSLFVGRQGKTLKVVWNGASATLGLLPTDGASTEEQAEEPAVYDRALHAILGHFGLS